MSTDVLTVALELALIQKRRRSRVGRGGGGEGEVASHVCRLLHPVFLVRVFHSSHASPAPWPSTFFPPHVPLRRKRPEQQKRSGLRGYRRAAFSFHKKGRARAGQRHHPASLWRRQMARQREVRGLRCVCVGRGMKVRAGEGEKQEQREARECDQ